MKLRWDLWLYGLVSAFIGGGAGAFASGQAVTLVDPDHFNIHGGLHALLAVMGITFIGAAIPAGMAYLKAHPLPAWDGSTDRRGTPSAT